VEGYCEPYLGECIYDLHPGECGACKRCQLGHCVAEVQGTPWLDGDRSTCCFGEVSRVCDQGVCPVEGVCCPPGKEVVHGTCCPAGTVDVCRDLSGDDHCCPTACSCPIGTEACLCPV
jgi:hypothetical protein